MLTTSVPLAIFDVNLELVRLNAVLNLVARAVESLVQNARSRVRDRFACDGVVSECRLCNQLLNVLLDTASHRTRRQTAHTEFGHRGGGCVELTVPVYGVWIGLGQVTDDVGLDWGW